MSNLSIEEVLKDEKYQGLIEAGDRTDDIKNSFMSDLSELTNYYNFIFSINQPSKKRADVHECALDGSGSLYYHKLRYLEELLFIEESEFHQKADVFLSDLIDTLSSITLSLNKTKIKINLQKIYEKCQDNSYKRQSLIASIEIISNYLSVLPVDLSNRVSIKKEVFKVIRTITNDLDEKTCFVRSHPSEIYLLSLLLAKSLPYSTIIDNLLRVFDSTPTNIFATELFSSITNISNDFKGISEKEHSTIDIILFRYIFEQLYIIATDKFHFTKNIDKCNKLLRITMKQLDIPAECCPKYEGDEKPIDAFPRVDELKEAIKYIQGMLFVISPFDILDCVQKAISCIEMAASKLSNYSIPVFAFEITFSLFIGAVLSSDVLDLSSLAKIPESYLPTHGLSSGMEYSRAKILAVSEELNHLADNMK